MTFYILFGAVALTFIFVKGLFLCFIPHGKIPPFVERTFRYIPPAVLAALVGPSVMLEKAADDPSLSIPRIVAGTIAFLISVKTGSIITTIISGMAILWFISYFSG